MHSFTGTSLDCHIQAVSESFGLYFKEKPGFISVLCTKLPFILTAT